MATDIERREVQNQYPRGISEKSFQGNYDGQGNDFWKYLEITGKF